MSKIGWQSIVAAVVLLAGFWTVRCYGGNQYTRGRREAEVAHSDSSRLWLKRGADSVSRIADQQVAQLVRVIDSLHSENARVIQVARDAQARYREARGLLANIPKETLDSTDRRVVAALDSMTAANGDLEAAITALSGHNNSLANQLAADSVAMRQLQESRDRWKSAYDTASTEIRQLKAIKTPKKPRFGFKWGFIGGIATAIGAIVATVALTH